jgi:hypothetical protein
MCYGFIFNLCFKKTKKQNAKCMICLDELKTQKSITVLACGHVMCTLCYSNIKSNKCPLCRTTTYKFTKLSSNILQCNKCLLEIQTENKTFIALFCGHIYCHACCSTRHNFFNCINCNKFFKGIKLFL